MRPYAFLFPILLAGCATPTPHPAASMERAQARQQVQELFQEMRKAGEVQSMDRMLPGTYHPAIQEEIRRDHAQDAEAFHWWTIPLCLGIAVVIWMAHELWERWSS